MRLEGPIHSEVIIDGTIDGIEELVIGQDVTVFIGPNVSKLDCLSVCALNDPTPWN